MNYHMAMNEVYTTSQLSRAAWGINECVFKGSVEIMIPDYDDAGNVRFTMPQMYNGNVKYNDGDLSAYEPTDEDITADDWYYWYPTPPDGES